MTRTVRRGVSSIAALGLVVAVIVAGLVLAAGPASAHGFSSVAYADLTAPEQGHVLAELGLEYDLLVVSAADSEKDDALFRQGDAAFKDGDAKTQAAALEAHDETVMAYVTKRFTVAAEGTRCAPARDGAITVKQTDGVPYAYLPIDYTCADAAVHEVTSTLFPDSEGFVRDTKTIVTYDLDLTSGSAALDAQNPSFSTDQSTAERFWEFFHLGTEHLLTGIDHILFLLALIAGSRRLREVVLAATTFTVAHSITLILAALGLVNVPSGLVEPLIALSIAVVAGWYLWRLWTKGTHALDLDIDKDSESHWSLDRAGWIRLAVVFCFGLIHGLGFAGALGIDQPFSWTLLWSLVVFNLGIEAVQLLIIALVFPPLALLRRRTPIVELWLTGLITVGVFVMGLVWFFDRVV